MKDDKMKQLKNGERPPVTARHWWAGKVVTCKRCKTEQELEATDIPFREEGDRIIHEAGARRDAWFACPTVLEAEPLQGLRRWVCYAELHVSIN